MTPNYERLERLAALLVRTHSMNGAPTLLMNDFATVLRPHEDNPLAPDCGTACCVLGLAALSGEFAAEGLTWYTVLTYDTALEADGHGNVKIVCGDDTRYAAGMEVPEVLFGLNIPQAAYFFLPGQYRESPTMMQVAERIRNFIRLQGHVDVRNGYLEELP